MWAEATGKCRAGFRQEGPRGSPRSPGSCPSLQPAVFLFSLLPSDTGSSPEAQACNLITSESPCKGDFLTPIIAGKVMECIWTRSSGSRPARQPNRAQPKLAQNELSFPGVNKSNQPHISQPFEKSTQLSLVIRQFGRLTDCLHRQDSGLEEKLEFDEGGGRNRLGKPDSLPYTNKQNPQTLVGFSFHPLPPKTVKKLCLKLCEP